MAEQVVRSRCHGALRHPPAKRGSRLRDGFAPHEAPLGLRVEEGEEGAGGDGGTRWWLVAVPGAAAGWWLFCWRRRPGPGGGAIAARAHGDAPVFPYSCI